MALGCFVYLALADGHRASKISEREVVRDGRSLYTGRYIQFLGQSRVRMLS